MALGPRRPGDSRQARRRPRGSRRARRAGFPATLSAGAVDQMTRGGLLLATDNSDSLYKLALAWAADEPSLSYGLAMEDLRASEDIRFVRGVLVEAALVSCALRLYLVSEGYPDLEYGSPVYGSPVYGGAHPALVQLVAVKRILADVRVRLDICAPLVD